MMRVYHIDNDFVAVGELDNALTRTTRYQTNTNPNPQAILSDKYKKDIKKEDKILNYLNKEQIVQELPDEVVTELPKEKVINQNFKDAEITQTELPEITNNQNETIAPPPELVIVSTPHQEETTSQPETTKTAQENIDTTNIVEMAKEVNNEAVVSASQNAETTPQPTNNLEEQINKLPVQ